MDKSIPKPFVWVWLTLLIILGAYIRIHGATYAYSPDEVIHVRLAEGQTLADVWRYSFYETHPPLSHFLRHYWVGLSSDPFFIRCESLLLGLALIPLYYFIGRLLHGEMAGMCSAAVITFSYGLIIQSFVVRIYIFLILFLSLAYYFYLVWRITRRPFALVAYGCFATFACLSHFSGILAIAVITFYEACRLYAERADKRTLAAWVLVNGVTGLLFLIVYILWRPVLIASQHFYHSYYFTFFHRLVMALAYPLLGTFYIYPSAIVAACALVLLLIGFVFLPPDNAARISLRSLFKPAGLAFGLGMFLVVSNLYPMVGGKYCLWLVPFIVPVTGWVLADLCIWVAEKLNKKLYLPWKPVLMAALLPLGWSMYDPAARFAEGSEYVLQEKDWQDVTLYLKELGPHDLIVGERDDIMLLQTPYPYMKPESSKETASMASVAPYEHTRILFHPEERRMERETLINLLRAAQAKNMLDGVDKLVFFTLLWSRTLAEYPALDFMHCPWVKAHAVIFPKTPPGHVVLLEISKEELFDQIVSLSGKQHSCFKPAVAQ